jgi:hypothetical protein
MSNYEFPDFDYDLPVIEGFTDTSWHNDLCPSLSGPRNLILWCDYADASKREVNPVHQFTLVQGKYGDADNQTTLCETDSLKGILAAIRCALAKPTRFLITERQVRIVSYEVEADSESDARNLVGTMDVNDYDILVDVPETEILNVKSI